MDSEGERPSVLLVGELNPFGADPRMALFYLPRTSSGNRLRRILGLSDVDYMRHCSRVNLCVGRWDLGKAREAARDLLFSERPARVVVLLGLKVRQAFVVERMFKPTVRRDKLIVSVPHPSGRCRTWNEPGVVAKLRAMLRFLAPDVPWGTATDAVDGGGDVLKVDT